MSVHTSADESLESARYKISEAIKFLSEIIIDECWGSEDFSASRTEDIH